MFLPKVKLFAENLALFPCMKELFWKEKRLPVGTSRARLVETVLLLRAAEAGRKAGVWFEAPRLPTFPQPL